MTLEVPALAAGFASKFDEIGPYIGFGSLVAVVAMAILVFAQGRELQRLREWAGTSPERLDALEQQVQNASIPQRPAGYVVPGAGPAVGAAAVGAAAAVAAPGAPPRPPGAPPAAPGTPGVPAPPGSPVVGAGAAAPGGPPRPTPPRPTPPGGAGAPPTRVLSSAAAGGPRAATAAGAAASSRDRDRPRGTDGPPRSIPQIIGVSVVGVVVLLALLFAFGVIGGGDEGPDRTPPGQNVGGNGTPTTTREQSRRYPPTEMKTLVLNASGTGGLAKDVSDSIEEKFRFPMGKAANYNSIPGGTDTSAITRIYYRAGAGESVSQNKSAAEELADFLKLKPQGRYVRAMPQTVKDGTPGQRVVVVVGADYARANPPAGGTSTGGATSTPGSTATPGSGTGGTGSTDGTGGTSGGTGNTGGTGGTPTAPVDPGGTSQLTPDTGDLGTDPGVDDGTGGAAVP